MPAAKPKQHHPTRRGLLLALGLTVICLVVLATGMGYITVTPSQVVRILGAKVLGWPELSRGLDAVLTHVVWDVRLPRIITSAVVGAALAMSGVVFQGLLLNPWPIPSPWGSPRARPLARRCPCSLA